VAVQYELRDPRRLNDKLTLIYLNCVRPDVSVVISYFNNISFDICNCAPKMFLSFKHKNYLLCTYMYGLVGFFRGVKCCVSYCLQIMCQYCT